MRKRGSVLLIIGVIVAVLLISAVGVGAYFYKFHVFKTLRVCVGNDVEDTEISCLSNEECINSATENITELSNGDVPSFIAEKLNEIFSKAIYCEDTCYVKNVRGLENIGELESCNSDEEEVKVELHGKELLEVMDSLKNLDN